MRWRWLSAASLCAVALVGCGGCGSTSGEGADTPDGVTTGAAADRPASCPARAEAPSALPGVTAQERTLEYWLARAREDGDLDAPLLDADAVRAHERALALPYEDRPLGRIDLLAPVDEAFVLDEVKERLTFMKDKLATGGYVQADGSRVAPEVVDAFTPPDALPRLAPELRVARGNVRFRCGPRPDSFYTESLDLRFDRNNCSTAREGEVVQLLARWEGGTWLARTGYTLGWVEADAPLSDRISEADAAGRLAREPRPITRRAVLTKAFELLDTPYGWGGQDGGRDCSRFLMDVLEPFGLGLPRHSGRQAMAGTFSIPVSEVTSEREKLLLIDAAAKKGIVLLSFPGHIMLYLGRTEDGTPMAIHSFAEYLEPCEGVTLPGDEPAETLRTVDRVTVSDLSLGRGTTRRAFIERIDRITVLGKAPGVLLGGAAVMRPASPPDVPEDACADSLDVAVFRSPSVPNAQKPLRVIVTATDDPGPAALVLVDPSGARVETEVHRIGGPPFTWWAKVDRPAPGRWTAVLGDGARTYACERFAVRSGPLAQEEDRDRMAWTPRWHWERDTDNLYAAWVEQLFDYPVEEDLTWPNLQTLLRDPERNLLHDHLSQGEDEDITLGPDCADLPYFLRAYFSWKVKLPFAFRRCSRGNGGNAPHCNELNTTLVEREAAGDVPAFSAFMRDVANGVHSASARTLPEDSDTDVYPVPMTREAILPGTVFADPYGHLLVVAAFIPQGTDRYGILVGADAQPDGTIGRRRFWRGSFLFRPEHDDVGAGFKAWRPLVYDQVTDQVTALDNDTLRASRDHTPWSMQQYEGTADDFYDRMEVLINPRPLDPSAMQRALVDALDEAVTRRIVSVDNGVEYMQSRGWSPIEMPTGYDVFETTGAWEDYATPARDMRLLISIDAVRGFPDSVERSPQRFGLEPADAAPTAARLRGELAEALRGRTFTYTRSDGSEQTLTLADVVDRAERFEMSYHPNDCVEIRWAAAEGSDEMSTCTHHAPRDHRSRMERYREWFQNRRRPPR